MEGNVFFERKPEDKWILNWAIFLLIVAQQASKKLLNKLKANFFFIFT